MIYGIYEGEDRKIVLFEVQKYNQIKKDSILIIKSSDLNIKNDVLKDFESFKEGEFGVKSNIWYTKKDIKLYDLNNHINIDIFGSFLSNFSYDDDIIIYTYTYDNFVEYNNQIDGEDINYIKSIIRCDIKTWNLKY